MRATTAITDPAAGGAAGAAAHAAFLARRRFGSLDGLRCLAILAVLWHHGPAFAALADPPRILTRGFLGVDLFFVLSGFLITTLLLRERAARGRFSLAGFYRRRILRIVPVYLLVVTAVSVWFVLLRGRWDYAPLVPAYYLFLANFLTGHIPLLYPLWSLSVEEQYYLVWPALLALLPARLLLPVLGGLVAANVAGSIGLMGRGPEIGPFRFALPNATYAPILLGSGLAVLMDGQRGFLLLRRLAGGRAAPLWTGALAAAAVALGPADLRGLPNLAVHLAMTLFLASLVLREDHLARPLLSWRPVARVGEISYGVYLYHLIGLHAATALVHRLPGAVAGPWLATALYVLASVAIAEASFRLVETPFLRLRHRPPRGAAAGAAAG